MKVLSTDIDEVYDDIIEEIGIDNFKFYDEEDWMKDHTPN